MSGFEISKIAVQLHQEAVSQGWHNYVYHGKCMTPFLREGDRLLVQKINLQDLQSGDIVLFKSETSIFAHRFLSRTKNGSENAILSKADRYFSMDKPFSEEVLIGKVVQVLRDNKKINLNSRRIRLLSQIISKASFYEGLLTAVIKSIRSFLLNVYSR